MHILNFHVPNKVFWYGFTLTVLTKIIDSIIFEQFTWQIYVYYSYNFTN